MAFQFLCPQGHLLQGEEALSGQQCQCPYCNTLFVVPAPLQSGGDPGPAAQNPNYDGVATTLETGPAPAESEVAVWSGPKFGPGASAQSATGVDVSQLPGAGDSSVVHILCPSGHSLETPRDMLGQEAMCPFCQAQFRLRLQDSVEYKRQRAEEEERRERQLGQTWLRWSIAVAVAVVAAVVMLIMVAASR